MRLRHRATSIALALSLLTVPRASQAFVLAEPASDGPPSADEDALADAQKWHVEADAKYNTADYEGAIAAWQKAFGALPRTPEANTYRSLILYNIAAAHEKLYGLRGDVEQLKKAKILLERFEASIDEIWAGAPEEGAKERTQVQAKLASIDAQIAAANKGDAPAKPPADEPRATDPPKSSKADTPSRARDEGRGLLIGGGVLVGLGVVGAAGMTATLIRGSRANDLDSIADDDLEAREDKFDRGRRANAGAIVAGVVGGLCLTAGVALIVVGLKKRRASRTVIAPVVGRGLVGLGVGGHF